MLSRRLAAAVLASGALVAVLPAAADARTIGSKSGSGDYAIALASGTANNPHRIRLVVTASPRQSVSGSWTMVCSRGLSAGSKSGSFSGKSTVRRTLKMPSSNPDSCTVSASGQLNGSGRIRVRLLSS